MRKYIPVELKRSKMSSIAAKRKREFEGQTEWVSEREKKKNQESRWGLHVETLVQAYIHTHILYIYSAGVGGTQGLRLELGFSEGWKHRVDHGVGVENDEGWGLGSGAAMPSGRILSFSVCACAPRPGLLLRAHFHEFSAALSTIALPKAMRTFMGSKITGRSWWFKRTSQPTPFSLYYTIRHCQQGSCNIYLAYYYINAFYFIFFHLSKKKTSIVPIYAIFIQFFQIHI